MSSLSIGQRVVTISSADAASKTDNSLSGLERGTVRYVGEVSGTKGEWIGVEWDDEGRGRHDGTHDGKRYFSVRESAPRSGSFVRETKIRGGTSLIEGVRSRYGEDFTIDVEGMREVQKSMNAPLLELVGFDKLSKRQREFHKLRVISVRGHLVDRLGDSEADRNIGEELANVQSLDLSDTLMHDWNEIAEIVGRLRRLESLDVGRNALLLPGDSGPLQKLQGALSNLTQLKLAYLEQTWDQVVAIASTLPRLEYLSVAANGISKIGQLPTGGESFRTLQSIDLSGNPIVEWDHIMRFAGLPNLEGLNVAECKITEITIPETADRDRPFPALISLNLNNNLVTDWQSVARLNILGLTDLRMRSNPVMETEDGGRCRQLLIASVASLFVCNGTGIDRSERRGAEIDYWKLYGQQYLKAKDDDEERAAFATRHPRYAEFVEMFGDPDDIDMNKVEDTTIKGNLVTVRIECPSKPGFKTVTKKLPPTMQVRKLRSLLQRVVGVRGHTLELSYKCMVYPDLIMPMDDELKEIDYYSIKNEDIIYVNF